MAARTDSRTIRPVAARTGGQRTGGVEIQLPWWAVALPAIAFAVLLVMLLNPGDAHAVDGSKPVAHIVRLVQQSGLYQAL
ncbi:hypothetical protein [Streptomyces sp. H27-D2]|uniref:hypothetical protein n=1 Tax=Streptomyces sp. H27-D2 TaxID=3046304 RepID=UPI002DB86C06|nr:hypothetical protein [Streptomyces sp. H27-D2]MEC4017754.1 hypothetical protein [Streptomyces sp. H27-D2]